LAAKYCPDADETHKGHMAQPRQHIRSTKPTTTAPTAIPTTMPTNNSIDMCIVPSNRIFTDDTGRFTPRSRSGNQYIMVAFHSISNAILIRPFQSKHDAHRIAAYKEISFRLRNSDFTVSNGFLVFQTFITF
jgi:hypothetical protein